MKCPGTVSQVEVSEGYVLACDVDWVLPWWSLEIESALTLAAAITALWAVAWVWSQVRRAA